MWSKGIFPLVENWDGKHLNQLEVHLNKALYGILAPALGSQVQAVSELTMALEHLVGWGSSGCRGEGSGSLTMCANT